MPKSRLRQNCLSGSARAKAERIVATLKRHKLRREPTTGAAIFYTYCQLTGRNKK